MKQRKLRSTAFALLAKREHSQKELAEKLIRYGANPDEVQALLVELAEENYQSDERMTELLLRHTLNKGRGINRLKQTLKKHDLDTASIQEELAAINWLAEAVQVRQKRFGEALASTPKDKAKQLRFLQYRGFETSICYQAIKTNDIDTDD